MAQSLATWSHLTFLSGIYVPGTLPPGECEPGLGSWSPGGRSVCKDEFGIFRMFIWIYVQNTKAKILEGSGLVRMSSW